MLVLPARTQGNLIVFDDDTVPERVSIALSRPRVARRADGSPRFRLLHWTAQAGVADPRQSGGRLMIDLDTQPRADEVAAAGLGARTALPMPWLDASVRLEGPQFDPIEADVSTAGDGTVTMAADLTPDAAALLAPLLLADTVSPLQVVFTGHVLVRLPPVEVTATADIQEIRSRVEISRGNHQSVLTRSIIDGNAHIEIRGAENAALEQALRDWVLDELLRRLQRGEPLSVRAAAADVVRWPVRLATTLDDFVAAPEREKLVETVILGSGETGMVPPVEVRALGDFAGQLERVDVSLQAPSRNDAVDLQFADDTPRTVRLDATDFRWRHRAKLRNRPVAAWSAWVEVRGATSVLVAVPTPARLQLEILAVGLDFTTRWASVRVVIEHRVMDSAPHPAPSIHAVELDAAHPARTWTHPVDGERGLLRARISYLSRRGQVVERTMEEIVGDQVIVGDPLDNERVQLALMPTGTGWDEVELAMVDVRHVDGEHVVGETLELRKLDDFAAWEAPARSGAPREVQWRLHAGFKDGRFTSGPWQAAGGGVAMVRIDGVPRRKVQLMPIYFDAVRTPKAVVRLRSGTQSETLVVTDRNPKSVTLPVGPFTWSVAWTGADGRERAESDPEAGEDVLVLPRFRETQ